jgi:hypothetical protein
LRFKIGSKPDAKQSSCDRASFGETPVAEPFGKNGISSTRFPIGGHPMGRFLLLWLLGVPIPILILAFGGRH